jgi:hypothetical protein
MALLAREKPEEAPARRHLRRRRRRRGGVQPGEPVPRGASTRTRSGRSTCSARSARSRSTCFGRTFYPIQVAEKGICWVRATFEGSRGTARCPIRRAREQARARARAPLGKRMPMHPTAAVRAFVEQIATEIPRPQKATSSAPHDAAGRLAHPRLPRARRRPARTFGAMLSNTASPTILGAGRQGERHPWARVGRDRRPDAPRPDGELPRASSATRSEKRARRARSTSSSRARRSRRAPTRRSSPTSRARSASTTRPGSRIPYMIPGFTDATAYAQARHQAATASPRSASSRARTPAFRACTTARRAHPHRGLTLGSRRAVRRRARLHEPRS